MLTYGKVGEEQFEGVVAAKIALEVPHDLDLVHVSGMDDVHTEELRDY